MSSAFEKVARAGRPLHWTWAHYYTDNHKHLSNQTALNVWCKACIQHKVSELRQSHQVSNGMSGIVTDEDLLKTAINLTPSRAGKPQKGMLPHLVSCTSITDETIKKMAKDELELYKSQKANKENTSVPPTTPQVSRTPSFSVIPASSGSSVVPAPRPLKRAKSSASEARVWSAELRKEYANDFTKMVLATNSSFNFSNNPEVRKFTDKWIDGSPHLDRHHISGTVLDRLSNEVVETTRDKIEGKLVTGQCDGWKNKAKTSVVATMITAGSEPHIVRTHDVSAQAKTGEELLKIVKADILHAQLIFLVTVIAWCSDDGGDARKMRRLLSIDWPWLIVLLCWAHQINLVVGDLLSLKIPLFDCISQAIEVIKWFNSHSLALGILNEEQASINMNATIFALILPCITRWTAHYCSLGRLEVTEAAIKAAWTKFPVRLINAAGARADAKDKARSIQAIVEDRDFWINIKHVKRILEPLAIAATILQAPNTRPYTILLTLGNLHRIYSGAAIDPQARSAITASLKKRWGAAQQDIFILSVVLNPYVRDRCFAPGHSDLTPAGLCAMAQRACERILRVTCDFTFVSAFLDYLNARGDFSASHMHLEAFAGMAKGKASAFPCCDKSNIDVVQIWELLDNKTNSGRNLVVKLAIHIQTVVGNSAGCERLFSELGLVHTKKRCLLNLKKAEKSSRVRMDLKRQHLAEGIAPKPRKRKLIDVNDQTPPTSENTTDNDVTPTATAREAAVIVSTVDFSAVSADLVGESEAERELDEAEAAAEVPVPSVPTATSPASSTRTGARARINIPLEDLFLYPTPTCSTPWPDWDDWWRGGIEALAAEEELHEILTNEAIGGSEGAEDDTEEGQE